MLRGQKGGIAPRGTQLCITVEMGLDEHVAFQNLLMYTLRDSKRLRHCNYLGMKVDARNPETKKEWTFASKLEISI